MEDLNFDKQELKVPLALEFNPYPRPPPIGLRGLMTDLSTAETRFVRRVVDPVVALIEQSGPTIGSGGPDTLLTFARLVAELARNYRNATREPVRHFTVVFGRKGSRSFIFPLIGIWRFPPEARSGIVATIADQTGAFAVVDVADGVSLSDDPDLLNELNTRIAARAHGDEQPGNAAPPFPADAQRAVVASLIFKVPIGDSSDVGTMLTALIAPDGTVGSFAELTLSVQPDGSASWRRNQS